MYNSPSPPLDLANIALLTNASQIGLEWHTPVSNGGKPIIDYTILTDTNEIVLTNITTTNAIITQLTQGVTYKYKVQARNDIGMSQSSNVVAILAAQAPAAP